MSPEDLDVYTVQHSFAQVAQYTFGMYVHTGNVNLLTWDRLSSHPRNKLCWDKQHSKYPANTREEILASLSPCTGPWWGQTSTPQVQPTVGGWRELILLLFISLSILQCILYFSSVDEVSALVVVWFSPLVQLLARPQHVPVMVAPWWRWEGKSFPFDGNTPCGTTVVAFGDLLGFKTACISAESKKGLTEMLHMLNQSFSSSEVGSDILNHKRAKKRCYAIEK